MYAPISVSKNKRFKLVKGVEGGGAAAKLEENRKKLSKVIN